MTVINRAPFNLLVDDPGDNLTGTTWNKAQIKDVLLDPIDAALNDAGIVNIGMAAAGAVDVVLPNARNINVWCYNTADATIQSMTPGQFGDRLVIIATQTGAVWLQHGGYASGKLMNLIASGPTPLAPTTGRATYLSDGVAWFLVHHDQGQWMTVASPVFYALPPLVWTVAPGNIAFNKFVLRGNTLHWAFYITASSLGGAVANTLYASPPLPNSLTPNGGGGTTGQLYDGAHSLGYGTPSQANQLKICRVDESMFLLNSGGTYVRFSGTFPVV